MPQARIEPAIPVSERPQTHALGRSPTVIGHHESQISKTQSETQERVYFLVSI